MKFDGLYSIHLLLVYVCHFQGTVEVEAECAGDPQTPAHHY